MSIIFSLQYIDKSKEYYLYVITVLIVFCIAFLDYRYSHTLDYGFFGVLLPVGVYLFKDYRVKLLALALLLVPLALTYGGVQWFGFLSLPLIAFYDGTRGKFNFKYFFYAYYPLHFVIIYVIALLI